jgi:hypothetical protein
MSRTVRERGVEPIRTEIKLPRRACSVHRALAELYRIILFFVSSPRFLT